MFVGHVYRDGAIAQKPLRTIRKTDAELLFDETGCKAGAIHEEVCFQSIAGLGQYGRDVTVFTHLDVDYVTVKSAFVTDARQSPKDFAMAKSINELVHFMGKKTIAKQEKGLDLAATMREIGIDFLYDLAERSQLEP